MSTTHNVVVTGASTGFGNLTARLLAKNGHRVYATMRDLAGRNAGPKAELEALGIHVVELDVTSDASVAAAATHILADAGTIDVLVNNAGTAHMGVTEAHSPASLESQLVTNVVGPHRITRAFLPGMREKGAGLVVFVSSVIGRFALPFTSIYTASKWAVEGYAESLAYELKPLGIDVAIVEPGAYATNIFNAMIGPDEPQIVADYGDYAKGFEALGGAMVSSAGDPQEVADAIAALVNAAPGHRALRTVVPANATPVDGINAATTPIQNSILEAYGFGASIPNAPAAV